MSNIIRTIESKKKGLSSIESYIVIRNNISYLRILGQEPNWSIMTATASEDHGGVHVCADQKKLIAAASTFCKLYGGDPLLKTDWAGREYAMICKIIRTENESNEDFERDNNEVVTKFFEIFDQL